MLIDQKGNSWPHSLRIAIVLLVASALVGCGSLPSINFLADPTPTLTPAPTPTPLPTPTPAATNAASGATPVATPQVTIPNGFTVVRDERLGYSFATPRGWNELDLRGGQFQTMAGWLGMGDQLTQLNDFLDSPEGQMLGKLYITDIGSAMFGGLPTVLAVSVTDAPGYDAESAKALVESLLESNAGALGDIQINDLQATTVNNLPAVRGAATANLAAVGLDQSAFAEVVGLLANDQIYLMLLLAPADQRAAKEKVFDQIIGTFRPE